MSRWSQYWLFVILISVFAMFGCGGASTVTTSPGTTTTAPSYHIVAVSDLHFNPLYDSKLFQQLVNALPPPPGNPSTWNPSAWQTIFQSSSVQTPSAAGTDTNYKLLLLTFASMDQNMEANPSPIILFTGDLLGHNIPSTYCTLLYSPNTPPPTCLSDNSAQIQEFINYTFYFVASQIQTAVGSAPVIYAPGNIDTYSGGMGPDTNFLVNNAPTVWNQFLEGAADPTFTTTFPSGGYYFFQYFPPNTGKSPLRIIALNSNSFVPPTPTMPNPTYDNASTELSWLSSQLQSAHAAGQKVWILMHVPPGANSQGIAQVATVPSDVNENDLSMMWDTVTLQPAFVQALDQYPGLVTLILAGHTHMDEFRILPTGDVLEQLPGISPCFGNNPAYKVLTITQNTFTPTDYESFDYDLSALPAPSQFGPLYQFSSTYGAKATLGSSLQQLYPELAGNDNAQNTYMLLYGSGTTSMNPVTLAPWNPINEVNWPIFACTIGDMDPSGYLACLNAY